MAVIVDFTKKERPRVLLKTEDRAAAEAFASEKAEKYRAAGKHGVISVYEKTTAPGIPAKRILAVLEV